MDPQRTVAPAAIRRRRRRSRRRSRRRRRRRRCKELVCLSLIGGPGLRVGTAPPAGVRPRLHPPRLEKATAVRGGGPDRMDPDATAVKGVPSDPGQNIPATN